MTSTIKSYKAMEEVTITIRAKKDWVVDGLRDLANAIENADEDVMEFESDYFDATIYEI